MQMQDSGINAVRWAPPGPGVWICEASHFPRPATATVELLWSQLSGGAMRAACARYGVPIDGFTFRAVNGWAYSTPDMVSAAELVTREEAAREALEQRPWLDDARRWSEADKPRWIARNLALQDVDLAGCGDTQLAQHLRDLVDLLAEGARLHFDLHLADMIPTGMLLAATRSEGLADAEVLAAMAGWSPASRPDDDLVTVASAVRSSGIELRSLDDLRQLGPNISDTLDRYLRCNGWRTVSRWDVDAPTLGEHPALTLAAISRLIEGHVAPVPCRSALPVEQALLEDAVATFGLRDDNVGVLGSWPMGLMRRGLREAGNRLVERGKLTDPDLALEATGIELAPVLLGVEALDEGELLTRRARRRAAWHLAPPSVLGDADPDGATEGIGLSSLRLLEGLDVYGQLMEATGTSRLTGTGIGERAYVGRAVVAHSTEEALGTLAPGDVLVAWATSPAYDHLLAVAGAVVTVMGGLLSHAAVSARELGIPAVLGVPSATSDVRTGDVVEVDPVAGRVTLLR